MRRLHPLIGKGLSAAVYTQTSDVVLDVTPRTAETAAEVRITQQSDWLRAAGMRLDMINEHYELLNDVTAHYETP